MNKKVYYPVIGILIALHLQGKSQPVSTPGGSEPVKQLDSSLIYYYSGTDFWFRVLGLWFRVSGLWFRVSGLSFRVLGLMFRNMDLWFRVLGLMFRNMDLWFRVPGLMFRNSCYALRKVCRFLKDKNRLHKPINRFLHSQTTPSVNIYVLHHTIAGSRKEQYL